MANWYKGKQDVRFRTLMDLVDETLRELPDDESKITLLQDIRDTMTIYLKTAKPKSNNRWWIFWR